MIRATRTYAILPVSKACYEEIMLAFQDAGYDHAFHGDNGRVLIDMHGVALARADLEEGTPTP